MAVLHGCIRGVGGSRGEGCRGQGEVVGSEVVTPVCLFLAGGWSR